MKADLINKEGDYLFPAPAKDSMAHRYCCKNFQLSTYPVITGMSDDSKSMPIIYGLFILLINNNLWNFFGALIDGEIVAFMQWLLRYCNESIPPLHLWLRAGCGSAPAFANSP
jgi:hypothetical protein